MNKTLKAIACLGFLVSSTELLLATGGVQVNLKTDKSRYRIGEKITFKLDYINISMHSLWLLPQTQTYVAGMFQIEKLGSQGPIEKIRGSNEIPSVALDGLAKEAVNVKPQGHLGRSLTAELSPTLPEWYGDSRKGIFLVFPGSALLLPGPGRYSVRAQLHSSADHPVNMYLPHSAKLWSGDVISDPLVIYIEQ
jgi:hypothetical protein